ncbi:MAG TPA: ABC transporter substrate binding protein [Steroidobacteraceae bacterium]|nr:ABC transporter substrate binding protein [Steroidobacteraceae bacterium]
MTGITLVHGFSAHHTQKVYPLVRPIRLYEGVALIATGLLGGFLLLSTDNEVEPAISDAPRIVAWVDFDVAPVRQGVARLKEHLKAQRFVGSGPVELNLIGADEENPSHLTAEMTQLIATKPALIVASSVAVAKTLLTLDAKIPIYFVIQSDPVREGLVPSLVATGSLTGYTFFVPLDVKIMELIRRVFPDARRVGIVASDYWLEGAGMSQDLFTQAKVLGLELEIFNLHDQNEVGRLLEDPRARAMQVWYIPYADIAYHHGEELAAVLARTPAPTVYARRKFLKMGGLISVQSVDEEAMDIWAKSIANILNGVPVGSIPVMRPKEIEIAVNAAAVARLDRATRERIAREATVFE